MDLLPKQALTHDFLLDGIFSFTSLHIASIRPESMDEYIATAIGYRDRALARVGPLMFNPSEDAIVSIVPAICLYVAQGCRLTVLQIPMFWLSALVGMVTIALHIVSRDRVPDTFTAMLIKLQQLWRGAGVIAQRAQAMGEEKEIRESLQHQRIWQTGTDERATMKLEPDLEHHLAELERIVQGYSPVYATCARYTRKAFANWIGEQRLDDILSWTIELDHEFTAALGAGEPIALLCVLVHGVCFHQIDDRWWAAGVGKGLVHESSTLLADRVHEWRPLIRWARERVGLSLPLIP
jgi:hypothetical protein